MTNQVKNIESLYNYLAVKQWEEWSEYDTQLALNPVIYMEASYPTLIHACLNLSYKSFGFQGCGFPEYAVYALEQLHQRGYSLIKIQEEMSLLYEIVGCSISNPYYKMELNTVLELCCKNAPSSLFLETQGIGLSNISDKSLESGHTVLVLCLVHREVEHFKTILSFYNFEMLKEEQNEWFEVLKIVNILDKNNAVKIETLIHHRELTLITQEIGSDLEKKKNRF